MAYKKEESRSWQKYGEYGGYCYSPNYGYPGSDPWWANTRYWYDKKEGRYYFEIEMPGVDKKDICLDMWGENFCFWGKRMIPNIRDVTCFPTMWNHQRPRPGTKTASLRSMLL